MSALRMWLWRCLAVAVVAAGVALAIPGTGHVPASSAASVPPRTPTSASCPRAVRGLGRIALVAHGRVEVINLAQCRVLVWQAPGASEVRFSPDGRWLAYGTVAPGNNPLGPVVIPADGRAGPARLPLGKAIVAWTWSKRGAVMYGVTTGGSLVAASPRGPRRTIASGVDTSNYGIDDPLALSPNGELAAIDRSGCQPTAGELDTVNLRTGARTVVLRRPGSFFTLAGWSSDGRWLLYWVASQCSGSLAADGWPLEAIPAAGGTPVRVVPHMLLYDDYLSWCGSDLVAAAGPDRETNTGSKLLAAAARGWHAHTIDAARALSWVSPACAPGGRVLAAAAGANNAPAGFGQQHRSIWLLRPDGAPLRRLSDPPAASLTDEAPRFSRDGRWVMFVRSQLTLPPGVGGTSRDTIELVPRSGAGGAIPVISFTSGDISYYDHFDWPYEIDWYRR